MKVNTALSLLLITLLATGKSNLDIWSGERFHTNKKLMDSSYFVILLGFAVEIGADINTVRILSVSTQVDVENANRTGSLAGGTRLFIKIVGHDAHVSSNNSIFVGPYPCLIPGMQYFHSIWPTFLFNSVLVGLLACLQAGMWAES